MTEENAAEELAPEDFGGGGSPPVAEVDAAGRPWRRRCGCGHAA